MHREGPSHQAPTAGAPGIGAADEQPLSLPLQERDVVLAVLPGQKGKGDVGWRPGQAGHEDPRSWGRRLRKSEQRRHLQGLPCPENSKDTEALVKERVSLQKWESWGRATSLLPDRGSRGRAGPPRPRLSGTPVPFPRGSASPLYSSPLLTRLSRQDPFVEPMFTWRGGEGGRGHQATLPRRPARACFPCIPGRAQFIDERLG